MSSPDINSAPRDSAGERALLQARLANFGRVAFVMSALFLVVDVAVHLTTDLPNTGTMIIAHVLSVATALSLTLVTRSGQRTDTVLIALDVTVTLVLCAIFIGAFVPIPLFVRPDLVQLLCVTDILALRAFMVPSSATRTMLIAVVANLAVMISTFVAYSGPKVHPDAPSREAYVLVAGMLAAGTTMITTLTSHTIFGLRARVKEAMQLGQYTLLRKIGEGAMGVVYEASHAMLRRRTAIKLLRPERTGAENLTRFEREVQRTSSLTHPNTVSIYDYGRTPDGVFYYAMEYLDGVDLETLVAGDGPQPPERVVHILTQIAGALHEAHGVGLIHRDIKPANVLLCDRGGIADVAKVVDFGLVKSISGDGDAAASRADVIVGTPLYMSPESIVNPSKVDARSDLYALGAVAYFLLTGRPPFTGQSLVEVCGQHLHASPVAPAEAGPHPLSPELDGLVLSCLAKAPDARPPSAMVLADELLRCTEAGAWTAARARDWWQVNGSRMMGRREGVVPRTSTPVSETVAVDLGGRKPLSLRAG